MSLCNVHENSGQGVKPQHPLKCLQTADSHTGVRWRRYDRVVRFVIDLTRFCTCVQTQQGRSRHFAIGSGQVMSYVSSSGLSLLLVASTALRRCCASPSAPD